MLVLSRHRDEEIVIGDDITICVLDIRGGKVRLGIKAPRHVTVHRREIYERIGREHLAADPGGIPASDHPSRSRGTGSSDAI